MAARGSCECHPRSYAAMDGAMPKTVLIVLAAVVALIVIVILLGMRYLRSDDEDDFDDDAPADHGRSRGRGSHYPNPAAQLAAHGQARLRRSHDDPQEARNRDRPRLATAAPGRGAVERQGGRTADDRGWREESNPAGTRAALSQRVSRPGRAGATRDHDDIGDPAAAGARRGHSAPARRGQRADEDFDARTARMPAPIREYDRDRDESMQDRDRWEGRDGRQGRDRRDGRPAETARKTAAAGERDGLPDIKPRPGRAKRDADGDWPSNEWDELSDVDYWAELASDRPLTATPSGQRPRRSSDLSSRPDAADRGGRSDRDAGRPGRPLRQREPARQPDPAPVMPSSPGLASPGLASPGLAGPGLGRDGLPSRPAVPDDDDPLTSPSFPRIAADDSRSYRQARRTAGEESQPSAAPAHGGWMADRSTQPHSYPQPAAQPAGNGTEYAAADYARSATEPYSIPGSRTVPGYQVPAAARASGYLGDAAGYSLPSGSLPISPPSASYLGSGYTGSATGGQAAYDGSGAAPAGSYSLAPEMPPVAAGGGGYTGETAIRGSYQPQDPVGFLEPAADPRGYQSPSAGGYHGVGLGGPSHPPATAGYAFPGEAADYRSDPLGYTSYSDPRSA